MKARMGGGRTEPTSLTVQSKMWPTPVTVDGFGGAHTLPEDGRPRGRSPHLKDVCKLWSTPKARDYRQSGPAEGKRNSPDLTHQATTHGHRGETTPTDGPPTGDLNPLFVEALMGLPANWSDPEGTVTGFTRWVTAWSRRLGRTPSGN